MSTEKDTLLPEEDPTVQPSDGTTTNSVTEQLVTPEVNLTPVVTPSSHSTQESLTAYVEKTC